MKKAERLENARPVTEILGLEQADYGDHSSDDKQID